MQRTLFFVLVSLLLLTGAACRAVPEGEAAERDALADLGDRYDEPYEERELPEVEPDASYGLLLDRALRADPELEEAYFAWAAALERVVAAGSPPDPTFTLGWMLMEPAGALFQNVLLGAAQFLPPPGSLRADAERALEAARTARERFDALRFERRGRFREAYAYFDRAAREIEISDRDLAVLDGLRRSLESRVAAGSARADERVRLEVEIESARNERETYESELRAARARVNAMMSRGAFDPLDAPAPLRAFHLEADDEALLRVAAERNPMMREVAGRARELALGIDRAEAEDGIAFMPEYFREGTDNMFMVGLTLPLRRDRIRAVLSEAEALWKEGLARLRVTRNDVAEETARSIVRFREAERRRAYLEDRIHPRAQEALDLVVARYGAGAGTYVDVVDARRALLEIERGIERARTEREAALGDLLACCGADVVDDGSGAVAALGTREVRS